mgnify:CR=1 FL=1
MSDPRLDACYVQLTRRFPEGASRARAEARLRTHPHFTVLRDILAQGDTIPVPASALAVLLETPDGPLLLPSNDAVQLPIIARYGGFQRAEMARVLAYLEARGEGGGDVFVDVGANVGAHTLQAMRHGRFRRAIAVEPEPLNAQLLSLNMRLNGLSSAVDVQVCALGAADGMATLAVNRLNCGDARLAPTVVPGSSLDGPAPPCDVDDGDFALVDVAVRTLDGLLTGTGVRPEELGLIWMDTQGSEGLIVAASRTLRACRVPLFVEFWPHGMKALDSYGALKRFVEAECTSVVVLSSSTPQVHSPTELDGLFRQYEADEQFTDLLLLR